jgi:hypothetical protein
MATPYDEWKTTETFSDEAEFVAKRRDELVREWEKDKAKVTEAIADALSDDGEDFFAGMMADLFLSLDATGDTRAMAAAARVAWAHLLLRIQPIQRRDAETAAQAEWDESRKDPRD